MLQRNLIASGGFSFRGFNYGAEADIVALVNLESPKGKGVAAFITCKSFFVHDPQYEPTGNWRTSVETALKSGEYTYEECKLFSIHGVPYPLHYSKTGYARPGKVLSSFESPKIWRGLREFLGRRPSWKLPLLGPPLRTPLMSVLPAGSELARLTEAMAQTTRKWFARVHDAWTRS